MKKSPKHIIGFLSLFFVTIVWGATFTFTKNALAIVPVYPFLAIRFTLAAAVFLPMIFAIPTLRRQILTKKTLGIGFCLGIILFGVYASQTMGLETTTPAKAGFLTGLSVLFVPLFSLFLGKKIPIRTWISVFGAVIGLAFLFSLRLQGFSSGDALVLLCAVFAATQILLTEKYAGDISALALAFIQIFTVALSSWIALVIQMLTTLKNVHTTSNWMQVHVWLQPEVLTALLINAVLGTSLAYVVQTYFQAVISATETAMIFSFEPVFSALIAWIILHSELSLLQEVGCLLLLTSMLLSDSGIQFSSRRFQKIFGFLHRFVN